PRRTADAPGTARLPGDAVRPLRLVDQGAPPGHRLVGNIPADECDTGRAQSRDRPGEQIGLADESAAARSRSMARRDARRIRHARPLTRWALDGLEFAR